ncbi:MAG: polyprenyl synthetase family protein [Deltaproteobacteria bacterium]|nr:polyprenyl synthetase family protein [Deltaproteobacteria bacterium]
MKTFDLSTYLKKQQDLINSALDKWLPRPHGPSGPVVEAMRYSLMSGGKRIRPILLMAGAKAAGGDQKALLPAACALECIHTYSLIHDDLPAMDNDDLRRGRPTCHKVYGEAVAILAGDGLLTYAFELICNPELTQNISPPLLGETIFLLARAVGVSGMVGGQTADILMEGRPVDAETLSFIHSHKTGALIQTSVEIGGLLGKANNEELYHLKRYGESLGLAFQIKDDLLDVEGDQEILGKPVGSDDRNLKATYPALFGLKETRKRARELLKQALSELELFDDSAEPLRSIARYIVERDR